MKRFLCFISILLALVISVPVLVSAETDDPFAEFTTEELVMLKSLIEEALAQRGQGVGEAAEQTMQKDVAVPVGKYTVGEDIPAGTYTIISSDRLAYVTVYSASGKRLSSDGIDDGATIGKLVLENGQLVEVEYAAVVFSAYKGLGF